MRNFNICAAGLAVFLISVAIGGCADDDKKKGGGGGHKSAPTVTAVHPAAGATGVLLDSVITAGFSMAMDGATINGDNFAVTSPGATPVPGTVSYDEATFIATFQPGSLLTASTVYTATVTTGVESLAGKAMATDYVWSFTTRAAPDITPPTVSSTTPAHLATDVPVNQSITAFFSEVLNSGTVNTSSFTLVNGGNAVPGSASSQGMTAVFAPLNDLAALTTFTATLTTDIEDLAGNAMVADYVWTFTTGAAPDITPPAVSSTTPAHMATGVPVNRAITASFSESLNPATATTASFTLMAGANAVPGSVTSPGMTAVFTPLSELAPFTTYTATLTTEIEDLAGNALVADYVWSFTTGATPDTTPPTVSSTTPAHMATGVPVNQAITAFFSEALNPVTVNTASFTLMNGASAVPGAVTSPGMTAVFTPLNDLAALTTFTATLTTAIKDLAGNALAANYVWTFTTGAAPDTTPPTVTSTNPVDAATDVPVNQAITAIFNEPLNPVTVNTASFKLMEGLNAVSGSVTSPGMTAVFTPLADLAPFTLFTATLTTEIKDLAGNALVADYVWSFTTGATPDTTPPTVTSTDPASLATGVPVNHAITAVFSEPLNPVTVNTASFTLTQGINTVPGSVTSPGTSAIFTPLSDLAPFTMFTARLTTEIKDLAGNALVADHVWTFQTGNVTSNGPAPVVLGTAGNFVILAKSAVSTTGATSIVGDLGLSPSAGSFFTGFSETMDPSNEFSTSPMVTGNLYAADYFPPTPTRLTTAVSDMQIAYTDAAGRSNPDFTELGAGDIDAMTLTPGLYKWGTSVGFANGVTISGGANDIWIFQIAGDLNVGNGAIVTLSGGAQAKNIFWQVAGQATLGTTADFKGIVLCQTAIVLNTGAVMNGRALAQTAVTLDANAVTQP